MLFSSFHIPLELRDSNTLQEPGNLPFSSTSFAKNLNSLDILGIRLAFCSALLHNDFMDIIRKRRRKHDKIREYDIKPGSAVSVPFRRYSFIV